MVSVQDWLEEWRKKWGRSEDIKAIEALALLLDGKASASETAKTITTTYEPSIRVETPPIREDNFSLDTKFPQDWAYHICDAIQTFGSIDAHKRLMSLLVEVSRQPDLLDDWGGQVKDHDSYGVYWSDVPGWEGTLVQYGLKNVPSTDNCRPTKQEKTEWYLSKIPGYLNTTRFAATLLEKGMWAEELPMWAYCALQGGLEHSYDEHANPDIDVKSDDWPSMIPAAAIWLLIAGKQIYNHCVSGDTADGWDGGEWSMEEWSVWKERLGTFAERQDFSEDCRYFAAETLKSMVEIEGEHGTVQAVLSF